MAGSTRLPPKATPVDKPVIPAVQSSPQTDEAPKKVSKVQRNILDVREPDWNRRIALHGVQVVSMSMPPDYSILHSGQKKKNGRKKPGKPAVRVLTRYWDNRTELVQLGREADWLYQRTTERGGETQVRMPPDIRPSGTDRVLKSSDHWNGIVEKWLQMSATERAGALDQYFQHTLLPDNDERAGLRGQSGVFAARDIKPMTVLGPYAGKYCHGQDLEEEQNTHGANVGRYTVDCSLDSIRLDLCGYGYGNITVCINACTTYRPDDPVRSANAFFLMVTYRGWPYVFVVSHKNIAKGEEILVDYGRYYWLGY